MRNKTKWKYFVVVQGKGTAREKRIKTNIKLYWVESMKRWCSIPERE